MRFLVERSETSFRNCWLHQIRHPKERLKMHSEKGCTWHRRHAPSQMKRYFSLLSRDASRPPCPPADAPKPQVGPQRAPIATARPFLKVHPKPAVPVAAVGNAAPHTTLASHQVGHRLAGGEGWAGMPRVLNNSRPSQSLPSEPKAAGVHHVNRPQVVPLPS